MHMTLCTFVTKCINQVFQGIEEKMHKQLAISKFVPVKTRDKLKYQFKRSLKKQDQYQQDTNFKSSDYLRSFCANVNDT